MADAHHDHASGPWFDKGDAAFWGLHHQHPNSTLGHDQGCPRRDRVNGQNGHNTTMAEGEALSSAIMTSACPTCGQNIPSYLTRNQTGMAQVYQRRISLDGPTVTSTQPAHNWGLWDTTNPVQHMREVDHMLETSSTDWQLPELNEAEIGRLCMEIDAIQATNASIDPQLLHATNTSSLLAQATTEKAKVFLPQSVDSQHPAYLATIPQSDVIGDSSAIEPCTALNNTIVDADVHDALAGGFFELELMRSAQLQQAHGAFTSGVDHHQASMHKCQGCGAEFAKRDGLRHHEESHTDKAHRYKCKQEGCSYAGGRYPKDLTRHELRHSKPTVPPFACDWAGCTKRFHRRDYLLRHQRKDHADPTTLLEVPTSRQTSSRNLRRLQSRSSGGCRMRRTPSSASAATLSSFDSAEMSDHLMPPPQNVLAVVRRVSSSFEEEVLTSFDDSSSIQSYAPSRLTPRTSQSSSGDPTFSIGHNSFQGA